MHYGILSKKKKKKQLVTRNVFIFKDFMDSCVLDNECFSVNNVLKENDDMKKASRNFNATVKYGWYNKRSINIRKRTSLY